MLFRAQIVVVSNNLLVPLYSYLANHYIQSVSRLGLCLYTRPIIIYSYDPFRVYAHLYSRRGFSMQYKSEFPYKFQYLQRPFSIDHKKT